jgi:hypothetical protein
MKVPSSTQNESNAQLNKRILATPCEGTQNTPNAQNTMLATAAGGSDFLRNCDFRRSPL